MEKKIPKEAKKLMDERFGHDILIALAAVAGDIPNVRAINAYYENRHFISLHMHNPIR